jgi:hypothetical protein
MAMLHPNFMDCVVSIRFKDVDGNYGWGSGFLYGTRDMMGDKYWTFLVSNKHIFERIPKGDIFLRFNPEGKNKICELKLNLKSGWKGHPDDDIDVAVAQIDFKDITKEIPQAKIFTKEENALDIEGLKSLGVTEGDFVYSIGFPMSIVTDQQNTAIVRNGSIAQIRNVLNGHSNDFIIDTFIFPGNSGGPVILKPELTSIQNTKAINTSYLIGIVHSYYSYKETAVSPQTLEDRIIFTENSGLGAVYPINYVDETITALKGDIGDLLSVFIEKLESMSTPEDLNKLIKKEFDELKSRIQTDIIDYSPQFLLNRIDEIFEEKDMIKNYYDLEINETREQIEEIKLILKNKWVIKLFFKEDVDKLMALTNQLEEQLK